jgi:hypothetical protein
MRTRTAPAPGATPHRGVDPERVALPIIETTAYRVRFGGHLGVALSEAFEGASVQRAPDGVSDLWVELPDQAALHGLLARIRDLGLPLLFVELIEQRPSGSGHQAEGVDHDDRS